MTVHVYVLFLIYYLGVKYETQFCAPTRFELCALFHISTQQYATTYVYFSFGKPRVYILKLAQLHICIYLRIHFHTHFALVLCQEYLSSIVGMVVVLVMCYWVCWRTRSHPRVRGSRGCMSLCVMIGVSECVYVCGTCMLGCLQHIHSLSLALSLSLDGISVWWITSVICVLTCELLAILYRYVCFVGLRELCGYAPHWRIGECAADFTTQRDLRAALVYGRRVVCLEFWVITFSTSFRPVCVFWHGDDCLYVCVLFVWRSVCLCVVLLKCLNISWCKRWNWGNKRNIQHT